MLLNITKNFLFYIFKVAEFFVLNLIFYNTSILYFFIIVFVIQKNFNNLI